MGWGVRLEEKLWKTVYSSVYTHCPPDHGWVSKVTLKIIEVELKLEAIHITCRIVESFADTRTQGAAICSEMAQRFSECLK